MSKTTIVGCDLHDVWMLIRFAVDDGKLQRGRLDLLDRLAAGLLPEEAMLHGEQRSRRRCQERGDDGLFQGDTVQIRGDRLFDQLEQCGSNVQQAHQPIAHTRSNARAGDQQRDGHAFLVELAVQRPPVLEELLTVIRGDDDERRVPPIVASQILEHRADVPIEPRISMQWFLKYPKLEESTKAVADREIDTLSRKTPTK